MLGAGTLERRGLRWSVGTILSKRGAKHFAWFLRSSVGTTAWGRSSVPFVHQQQYSRRWSVRLCVPTLERRNDLNLLLTRLQDNCISVSAYTKGDA